MSFIIFILNHNPTIRSVPREWIPAFIHPVWTIPFRCLCVQCTLPDSGFFFNFLYQSGVKSTVFWVFEDLRFKSSEGYDQNWCFPDSLSLAETANWAQSGKHQFWSEPSEILNLRSSITAEDVAFTPPWYQTWWNP